MRRREYLKAVGGISITGIAGCAGDKAPPETPSPTVTATTTPVPSDTVTSTAPTTAEPRTSTATAATSRTQRTTVREDSNEPTSPPTGEYVLQTDAFRFRTYPYNDGEHARPAVLGEIYRNGRYLTSRVPAPIFGSGSYLEYDRTKRVQRITRTGPNDEEIRGIVSTQEYADEATSYELVQRVEVSDAVDAANVELTITNTGANRTTLDTPSNFIGSDVAIANLSLEYVDRPYRFGIDDDRLFDAESTRKWKTFELGDDLQTITAADSDHALTYGFDGTASTVQPKLAMTDRHGERQAPVPTETLKLFTERVSLDSGDTARFRGLLAITDGGENPHVSGSAEVRSARTVFRHGPATTTSTTTERTGNADSRTLGNESVSATVAVGDDRTRRAAPLTRHVRKAAVGGTGEPASSPVAIHPYVKGEGYLQFVKTNGVESVSSTSRDGTTSSGYRVTRQFSAGDASIRRTVTTLLAPESQVFFRDVTFVNDSERRVTLDTPGGFIGRHLMAGEVRIRKPRDGYRFGYDGATSHRVADLDKWQSFQPRAESIQSVTAFTDEHGITFGLYADNSDVATNLYMTEREDLSTQNTNDVGRFRLYTTAVTLTAGERASMTGAVALHRGGDDGHQRGHQLVREAVPTYFE
ncbi:MAG: hypothetical protein ABEI57_00255 [Halapricum sp.]